MPTLEELVDTGVSIAEANKIAAKYALDFATLLGPVGHAQHDVADARRALWVLLERSHVSVGAISRLWACSKSFVRRELTEAIRRARP